MALLLAGIDEAGYGPLLGPLCVGYALFRVEGWEPGDEAPDLWKRLSSGVTRRANDKRGRVAIADSKELKLANDSKTRHPLVHLERGVLAMLRAMGVEARADEELFSALGAVMPRDPWYAGPAERLPLACTDGQLSIAGALAGAAQQAAGVELVELRCRVVPEGVFNETVKRTGTKAAATMLAIGEFLRGAVARRAGSGGAEHLRVVCDRLGGRAGYAGVLSEELGLERDAVRVLSETDQLSRYELAGGDSRAGAVVQFQVEAESAHLPVALASMAAKLVRELCMHRFNRHWCGVVPDLKPTAGYRGDAWRWLKDAEGALDRQTRDRLVRIA